jgi:hypothetical protein
MNKQGFGWWRVRARCVVTMLLVATAGCATTSGGLTKDTPAETKQSVVRERAEARWQAMINGDFPAAYAYLSPASREMVTVGTIEARAKGAITYTGIKVDTVSCEALACKVKLWLTYDHKLMKGVTTPVDEAWIIDGGQAWYVWPG